MTTTPLQEPAPPPQAPTAQKAATRDDLLRDAVGERAATLWQRYRKDLSDAVAALAVLRRAVDDEPGQDLAVLQLVFEGFPERLLGRDDQAGPHEAAAHEALTLFALHQQSRREASMHHRGRDLGRAVATLGRRVGEDAVRRRFQALGTASTPAAVRHHLRGLVTQLRGESIPLDYGRLAVDLRRLRDPKTAPGVRLAWGRGYHRGPRDADEPQPAEPTTPSTSTSPDDVTGDAR